MFSFLALRSLCARFTLRTCFSFRSLWSFVTSVSLFTFVTFVSFLSRQHFLPVAACVRRLLTCSVLIDASPQSVVMVHLVVVVIVSFFPLASVVHHVHGVTAWRYPFKQIAVESRPVRRKHEHLFAVVCISVYTIEAYDARCVLASTLQYQHTFSAVIVNNLSSNRNSSVSVKHNSISCFRNTTYLCRCKLLSHRV